MTTTTEGNVFRTRATITVTVDDFPADGQVVEVTFPFPSMKITEAMEWEQKSGRPQREFWTSVSNGEVLGLKMLLWQALNRWSDRPGPVAWDDLPDVDLFGLRFVINGMDDEQEAPAADPALPTISNEEGSTSD